jgi:hypothetical protein
MVELEPSVIQSENNHPTEQTNKNEEKKGTHRKTHRSKGVAVAPYPLLFFFLFLENKK